jgi:hypothetical protein
VLVDDRLIRVPVGLVVLVGPPASGKTSFAPVTMLRFTSDVTDLLQQHGERKRPDVTAADVRAYAATMTRDAGTDQLRSEGAAAVHDVPGRRQGSHPP